MYHMLEKMMNCKMMQDEHLEIVIKTTIENLKKYVSKDYFSSEIKGYATPNQTRDWIIDIFCRTHLELLNEIKKLAINEDKRREISPGFVKCKRCYGFHSQIENIDGLCEKCEASTAPFRYDMRK